MENSQIVIIILFIIIVYCLTDKSISKQLFPHKHKETFVNLDNTYQKDETYDYLLTNGTLFYLYNSRDLIVKDKNPLIFETLDEAEAYRASTRSPKLNLVDLVVRKSEDDPQENYERECAKKIAPFGFRTNTCLHYIKDEDKLKDLNNSVNAVDIYDRELESCMIKNIVSENEELKPNKNNENEIQFMSQFF